MSRLLYFIAASVVFLEPFKLHLIRHILAIQEVRALASRDCSRLQRGLQFFLVMKKYTSSERYNVD